MIKALFNNLILPLLLISLLVFTTKTLGFTHPLGGVIIALLIYFLAQLVRKNKLFGLFGILDVQTAADISKSKTHKVSFLIRKSTWIILPLLYVFLVDHASLKDLGILMPSANKTQVILLIILGGLSFLMYRDAKGMGISLNSYLKSFSLAFLAAGLPEDLLIIGLIGGRTINLFNTYLTPLWAMILTAVIVDSLFSLSHIPAVKRAHDFYSKHMTGKDDLNYKRMFIQMFIFAIPGWIFYFLSSQIFFSIWWHSLGDIAAFLPPKTEE